MITKDNIYDVVGMISEKDKKRIKNSNKEYVILELHTFNVGSYVTVRLTNSVIESERLASYGDCLLSINDKVFDKIKQEV